MHPRREPLDLFGDDRVGAIQLPGAPRHVLLHDPLQVVDVVEEDLIQIARVRLDVARHGDVDDEKRPAAPRPHDVLDPRARQHRLGGAGRRDHDVGGGQRVGQRRPRHRAPVEMPRERFGGGERPARDRQLLHVLRLQVDARELRHLAGPEDQHAETLQVAEDLLRHRHGPLAESGLGPDAFADGERGVEQTVRQRAGVFEIVCGGVSVLDLTENLRLADDQGIESGGDAKQVTRRVRAAVDEQVRRHRVVAEAVILAHEPAEEALGPLRVGHRVDLRAVARGQHDQLAAEPAFRERAQRTVHPLPREVDALAQLYRCGTMADAHGVEPHRLKLISWLPALAGRYTSIVTSDFRLKAEATSTKPRNCGSGSGSTRPARN